MQYRLNAAAKLLGRGMLLLVIGCTPLVLSCRASLGDCFGEIDEGRVYTLTILERYDESSRFRLPASTATDAASCEGIVDDGLGPGTLRVRARQRETYGGSATGAACYPWRMVPEDPVGDIAFPEPDAFAAGAPGSPGLFTVAELDMGGGCSGQYHLAIYGGEFAVENDVVGRPAVDGELPPVVVRRSVVGEGCGTIACGDAWAAELTAE